VLLPKLTSCSSGSAQHAPSHSCARGTLPATSTYILATSMKILTVLFPQWLTSLCGKAARLSWLWKILFPIFRSKDAQERTVCPFSSPTENLSWLFPLSTKVKPFKCGINNCSSAFGDPSSCTRHRKETHGRLGAYQCPQRGCTSR